MPKSQKPIVTIISSDSITDIDLNNFIDPNHIGEIISGGTAAIDFIIEKWAKDNKKEWIYFPTREDLYEDAADRRNQDMVDFCDVCLFFWNGKSKEILKVITYCEEVNRPYICHLIEDFD